MYRTRLCFLFVLLLLPAQGCGVFDFLKGDSGDSKGVEKTDGKDEQEIARLKAENIDLKQQIAYLKKVGKESLEDVRQELAEVKSERDALIEALTKQGGGTQRRSEGILRIKRDVPESSKEGPKDLKIKVLSGDGDLDSARMMAKRLKGMNCEIRLIGHAPRSDFRANTVYYKPQFERQGRLLVSKLGDNTVMKPLTWSSVFDLIIVTGKHPSR